MTPSHQHMHDARLALACLDLTSLNNDDDDASIAALCAKAQGRHGSPAAVCVWPRFVARARAALPATVRVAAVANFPDGALDADRAVRDTAAIVDAGGDEVDLVLPWRALAAGDRAGATKVVNAVRRACTGRTLKLIIESGQAKDLAAVRDASLLGLDEGVEFLKTSTGKTAVGATAEAARVMLETIASHARGKEAGFKASGGVKRVADAQIYLKLVSEVLGPSALTPARLRFGASGLLGDIEATLEGRGEAGNPGSGY